MMARKASKASISIVEDETSPSNRSPRTGSRSQSIYEKLPIFSDVRNRTEGKNVEDDKCSMCPICQVISVPSTWQNTRRG